MSFPAGVRISMFWLKLYLL